MAFRSRNEVPYSLARHALKFERGYPLDVMKATASLFSWLQITAVSISISLLASCVVTAPPSQELTEGQVGHRGSGIVFPEELGEFTRGKVENLDQAGLDVSAAYTRFALIDRLEATVFVYPAANVRSLGSSDEVIHAARRMLLEGEFEGVKREVLKHHPGAELGLEDSTEVVLHGKERDAKVANFLYTEKAGFLKATYFSTASLIALDQWLILIRLTAIEGSAYRSRKEISGFIQAFMEANDGHLIHRAD